MPDFVHRATKQFLKSVPYVALPEPLANYIEDPDLSAVAGQPNKYWVITGDVITLADEATRDAIDAAILSDARDDLADETDSPESFSRAFALAVLDEFNAAALKINEILDAIDSGSSLTEVKVNIAGITDRPQRTIAQLKTAVRNKADI